jgi:hypothetical protein
MPLLGYKPSRAVRCHLATLTRMKVQRWDREQVPNAELRDG